MALAYRQATKITHKLAGFLAMLWQWATCNIILFVSGSEPISQPVVIRLHACFLACCTERTLWFFFFVEEYWASWGVEAFNSFMWCHSWSPIQLFFYLKRLAKRKEIILFTVITWLIYWFEKKRRRHRKLLRILFKKKFCDLRSKDIFFIYFDARWGEQYINQVWVSNVDFALFWFRASFTLSVDSKRNRFY